MCSKRSGNETITSKSLFVLLTIPTVGGRTFLYRTVNTKNVLQSIPMDQSFATPDEATEGGIEYAKKWIDDGKPELEKLKKE
jgi:hypothetical protein